MDVKIALLNRKLDEAIEMAQLEGFNIKCQEYMVCELKMFVNGFKQTSKA